MTTPPDALAPREPILPPYQGRVEIKGIWDEPGHPRHGEVVSYYAANTITFDARGLMARALAGDPAGHIVAVAWGTDGTAAQRSDTGCKAQVASSTIVQPITYPRPESVMFTSVLARGEGTGYTYKEVALMADDDKCFARFVFPNGQYKFAQLRMSVNWEIIFI
jgi:hypothetical protein